MRIGNDCRHGLAHLTRPQWGLSLEVGPGDVVELDGERRGGKTVQGRPEGLYRVERSGLAAVSALVGHLEGEVLIDLLTCLDFQQNGIVVLIQIATGTLVDDEFGVNGSGRF